MGRQVLFFTANTIYVHIQTDKYKIYSSLERKFFKYHFKKFTLIYYTS